MIVHELKTLPSYFRAMWEGDKTFEVRLDDRGFQCGDVVNLREWDRDDTRCNCNGSRHNRETCAKYTGRRILAEIGFVMASTVSRGQQRGFSGDGYVVFSLINVQRVTEDLAALARVAHARGDGLDMSEADWRRANPPVATGGLIPIPRRPSPDS